MTWCLIFTEDGMTVVWLGARLAQCHAALSSPVIKARLKRTVESHVLSWSNENRTDVKMMVSSPFMLIPLHWELRGVSCSLVTLSQQVGGDNKTQIVLSFNPVYYNYLYLPWLTVITLHNARPGKCIINTNLIWITQYSLHYCSQQTLMETILALSFRGKIEIVLS